jgi:hypothetical protein
MQIAKTTTRRVPRAEIEISHDHETGAEIGATEMTTSVIVAETETAGETGVVIAAEVAVAALHLSRGSGLPIGTNRQVTPQ